MKENQRIALTKRLLQEGLLRLLSKKPLEKINVTELCNESGINRATFYRHYNVPRDVLLDMELAFEEKANSLYNKENKPDIPSYFEDLMAYLYQHADLLKIFIENNSADDHILLMQKIFDRFVHETNAFSYLSHVDEESVKLITAYITGGGYHMLRQWLVDDIQKTPKEIAELILKLMNYTVTDFDAESI